MRPSSLMPFILAGSAAFAGCKIERNPPSMTRNPAAGADSAWVRGVRTVIYHVPDLAAATEFYTRLLGRQPYFHEPFYVGYQVGAYELGLDPDTTEAAPGAGGAVAYWTVEDLDAALARAVEMGASEDSPAQEVGGGIRTGTVRDPFGNVIGFIDTPASTASRR